MGFQLTKNDIDCVVSAQSLAIERILKVLQVKTERILQNPDLKSKPDSEVTVATAQQPQVPQGRPVEKQTQNQGAVPQHKPPGKGPTVIPGKKGSQQPDPNIHQENQGGLNLPVPPVYYPNLNQRKE